MWWGGGGGGGVGVDTSGGVVDPSGESVWIDRSYENVINCFVDNDVLTLVSPPPEDLRQPRRSVKRDFLKWFEKAVIYGDTLGWRIKRQVRQCPTCGSPWCIYHTHRELLDRVISRVRLLDDDEPAEAKRLMAYQQGIYEVYGRLGFRRRKRVGYCYQRAVRQAFTSNFFRGFRAVAENDSSSDSSSDSN